MFAHYTTLSNHRPTHKVHWKPKNPPLSRCKSCKRLIGTTSNLSCRGKNILVKYFSSFIKHLSSTLCLIEWQGSFSQRLTDICSTTINVFGGVPAKRRAQHLGVTRHPVVSLGRCSSITYLDNASLRDNSVGGVFCSYKIIWRNTCELHGEPAS